MPETPHPGQQAAGLSRRSFLGGAAAAAGLAVLPLSDFTEAEGLPLSPVRHTFTLRRREDMLRLAITIEGMTSTTLMKEGRAARVFEPAAGMVPYLIVNLGPQVLGEQDFVGVASPAPPAPAPPVGMRLSGDSRVAFRNVSRLLRTVPGLLQWASGVASVEGVGSFLDGESVAYRKDPPRMPRPNETLIEMPWWLVLSPHRQSGWAHADDPVTLEGRTEAWHTRLGTRPAVAPFDTVENASAALGLPAVTVRAVWLRDPNPGALIASTGGPEPAAPMTGLPFPMKPDPRDRSDLVRLSTLSQVGQQVTPGGVARAIPATISLSPLGGTMRAEGTWNAPNVANIVSWQQRIWQGRVTFTRILRMGFLFPWAIPAVVVTTVTRKFKAGSDGTIRPYLERRTRVLVTKPDVKLNVSPFPDQGRHTPFVSITCRTKATPDVVTPAVSDRFVPSVPNGASTAPVMFDLVGTDREGKKISFQMPLMFAEYTQVRQTNAADVITAYNSVPIAQRIANLSGQSVAFATPAAGKAGGTAFPTGEMILKLIGPAAPPAPTGLLAAYPEMQMASIVAEPVSRISGSSTSSRVVYPASYLANEFAAGNSLETFLQDVAGVGVTMGAKSAGAMVVPTFSVAGLSRKIGPILGEPADLAKYVNSTTVAAADLAAMFGDIKLLGGISLADILGNGFDLAGPAGMRVTSTVANGVSTTVMSWKPNLDVLAASPAQLLLNVDNAKMSFTSTTKVSLKDGTSTNRTVGEITMLGLKLVGETSFIAIMFDRLAFTSETGKDTDIDVKVGEVSFLGGLSFMEALSKYLPLKGTGLSIDVDGSGIDASLRLALPKVALGAFTLTGISAGVGVTLPFGSDPMRFRFNFSTPEDPFGCTVLGIGGAGSFVSAMGLDGVERLEVTAMVQACAALDVGVASGMVRIAAGMTFAVVLAAGDSALEITAFVRITGQVEVICIIEVCIELYLGLTLSLPTPGKQIKLTGEASLTVKVSVLCFSTSVDISVRRTINGPVLPEPPGWVSSGVAASRISARELPFVPDEPLPTPSFGDGMSADDWSTWCEAFA